MIIKWDYFRKEETEAHKNPSSSLFYGIYPKYMRATTEMHWGADQALWGAAFCPLSHLPTLLSHCFSLLNLSPSFSPRFFSLSFVNISDLSAASLDIISPSSDVQTQISKTSFLKVQTLLGASRGSLTWQWYGTRNASSCYLSENVHLTIWKFWHWDNEKA